MIKLRKYSTWNESPKGLCFGLISDDNIDLRVYDLKSIHVFDDVGFGMIQISPNVFFPHYPPTKHNLPYSLFSVSFHTLNLFLFLPSLFRLLHLFYVDTKFLHGVLKSPVTYFPAIPVFPYLPLVLPSRVLSMFFICYLLPWHASTPSTTHTYELSLNRNTFLRHIPTVHCNTPNSSVRSGNSELMRSVGLWLRYIGSTLRLI